MRCHENHQESYGLVDEADLLLPTIEYQDHPNFDLNAIIIIPVHLRYIFLEVFMIPVHAIAANTKPLRIPEVPDIKVLGNFQNI